MGIFIYLGVARTCVILRNCVSKNITFNHFIKVQTVCKIVITNIRMISLKSNSCLFRIQNFFVD
jgi:hypothetical protein